MIRYLNDTPIRQHDGRLPAEFRLCSCSNLLELVKLARTERAKNVYWAQIVRMWG